VRPAKLTFDDVAGVEEAKAEFGWRIVDFLSDP
jgi:ATP-dependent Zn protease